MGNSVKDIRGQRYIIVLILSVLLHFVGCRIGTRIPESQPCETPAAYRFEPGVSLEDIVADPYVFAGAPRSERNLALLANIAFLVGYDEIRKNPAWVAYRIPPDTTFQGHSRISRFSVDARTLARISHQDYSNTGYSRGHMAPSYAIFSRYGREAQKETYLMSNVCPQYQWLNGGAWNELESRIARTENWAYSLGGLWIITGPVYNSEVEVLPCGVEIPDAFYKIVLDIDDADGEPRVLAFLMSHKHAHNKPLEEYLVSVDEIEALTGIDFFWAWDDTVEEVVESLQATSLFCRN